LWAQPCFDCWEEFPDKVHTHTLAAIYGGLQAYSQLVEAGLSPTLAAIRQFIFDAQMVNGRFVKFAGSTVVDASLLGLATPYRVVEPGHPAMRATVAQITAELGRGGGLHRYAADTYYGGGEWVLLTAWLAWYYAEQGEASMAQSALSWVEAQADQQGQLPEQVPNNLNDPGYLQPWQARWGQIANPLLWSHAQYLIAATHLSRRSGQNLGP
jgi:GH15 family glucan-1,4-alpha-glucosidase